MKKLLTLLLLAALASALFSGCNQPQAEPAPPAVSDPADAPPAEGTPDIAPLTEMDVTLYLPNDMADGFETRIATVKAQAQGIVDALIENGALPAGMTVHSFQISDNGVETQVGDTVSKTMGDKSHIDLDVSSEFSEALLAAGSAGESMYMGSLVNTMLAAYDSQTITVTCDGATIETGHTVYDEPMGYQDLPVTE